MVVLKEHKNMKNDAESVKYYKVVAMCGHVGKRHYLPVSFAIRAIDAHEAAEQTRNLPRVKHDKKDAIISCVEITHSDYLDLRTFNKHNPFLNCRCRRDQEQIEGLEDSILPYLDKERKKRTFESRDERISYLLRKERIYDDRKNDCFDRG
jgi:hypothetical protein